MLLPGEKRGGMSSTTVENGILKKKVIIREELDLEKEDNFLTSTPKKNIFEAAVDTQFDRALQVDKMETSLSDKLRAKLAISSAKHPQNIGNLFDENAPKKVKSRLSEQFAMANTSFEDAINANKEINEKLEIIYLCS